MKFMRIFFLTFGIFMVLAANSVNAQKPKFDKGLMIEMVNNARKNGCNCGDKSMPPAPPLTWNKGLEKAAQLHSNDMYRRKYFDHKSPDGKSVPRTRLKRANYIWSWTAENIAMGQKSTREVVEGWLSSPPHCENIMNPEYKEVGGAVKGLYWAQVFGTQKIKK